MANDVNEGTFNDVRPMATKGRTTYDQTAKSGQILAKKSNPTATLGSAGNAVALGVTSDDVVVLVWNDNRNVKITWNGNPHPSQEDIPKGLTTPSENASAGWVAAQDLITGAGEFCKLVIDADNGIHVIAYDTSRGDLKYAYVPYDSDNNQPDYSARKVCTVDSYLETGSQLTLDVVGETRTVNGEEKTVYIPHIGYWASYPEKPRYAYLKDYEAFKNSSNENNRSGAITDTYTGIWECGLVPSASSVKEGRINVGLWKKTDGSRRDSFYTGTTGADATGTNNAIFSTADETKGKCYGNGTDNAVLAYVVIQNSSTHNIETAQMR